MSSLDHAASDSAAVPARHTPVKIMMWLKRPPATSKPVVRATRSARALSLTALCVNSAFEMGVDKTLPNPRENMSTPYSVMKIPRSSSEIELRTDRTVDERVTHSKQV